MKVGIDSYSFHRYFKKAYPGLQADLAARWGTADDFVGFAGRQGVDEVALDTWAFPVHDECYVAELRARIDDNRGRACGGIDLRRPWRSPMRSFRLVPLTIHLL